MELLLEFLRHTRQRKMSADQIPPDKLAAFLDGRLEGDERANVEARLATDPEARAEMIATARLLSEMETAGQRRLTRWKYGGVAAAAAAVMLLAVWPRDSTRTPRETISAERRSSSEDGGAVSLLSPRAGEAVPSASVEFQWVPETNASYRLTVADSAGNTLWTSAMTAARVSLPDSVQLPAGSRYYWYVDALLQDGSSITSGPRAFRTR